MCGARLAGGGERGNDEPLACPIGNRAMVADWGKSRPRPRGKGQVGQEGVRPAAHLVVALAETKECNTAAGLK